jgi:hypothetical protein
MLVTADVDCIDIRYGNLWQFSTKQTFQNAAHVHPGAQQLRGHVRYLSVRYSCECLEVAKHERCYCAVQSIVRRSIGLLPPLQLSPG